MQPSHELVELDTSDEDDAHNSISTDSSHDEPATVSVAEISLATFNLGHWRPSRVQGTCFSAQ